MHKKAQTSAEFSMGSVFSLFACFILLGGLWYFGAMSFVNLIPQRCILPAGISCVDQRTTEKDVGFVFLNNMGTDVIVEKIKIKGCEYTGPKIIKNNEMQKFEFSCSLKRGNLKTEFYLDFKRKDTNLTKTWEGELLAVVP